VIRSFSISIEDLEVLEKLKDLAGKEGNTLSTQIVIALKEYVQRHCPGNPQVPLERFTDVEPRRLPPNWCEDHRLWLCPPCAEREKERIGCRVIHRLDKPEGIRCVQCKTPL